MRGILDVCRLLPAVFVVLACGGESMNFPSTSVSTHDVVPETARAELTLESSQPNPFLVPDRDRNVAGLPCASGALRIENGPATAPIRGSITFTNDCGFSVAILLTPVEVRTRLDPTDWWMYEGMGGPYARLYVYRRELGHGTWFGSGGALVLGLPGFVVLEPHSSKEVPLQGDSHSMIKPGEYGAFFHTYATATDVTRGSASAVELNQSLAEHYRTHTNSERLARSNTLMRVHTKDTFFEVW